MPQRTLRFRIRPDGYVEETVEGVVGQSCNKLTENLENALGVVESSKQTSEAFVRDQNQSQTIPAKIN